MAITVTCPSCSSSFPVDPAKIPVEGVNARCTSCGEIFRVERPAEPEAEAAPVMEEAPVVEEAPVYEAPPVEPPPVPVEEPVAAPEVVVDPPPLVEAPLPSLDEVEVVPPPPLFEEPPAPAVEEPVARVEEPVAAPPPPEPEPEPAVSGFRFGKRDPTDKAKRLARVLVSDMIMYNADRHQTALEDGTLVQDFEEEIEKSWKEFVEQVGAELAEGDGRQFWKEALNDILAKGEQLF